MARSPTASSRAASQAGLGPTRTPRITRAVYSGQRAASSTRTVTVSPTPWPRRRRQVQGRSLHRRPLGNRRRDLPRHPHVAQHVAPVARHLHVEHHVAADLLPVLNREPVPRQQRLDIVGRHGRGQAGVKPFKTDLHGVKIVAEGRWGHGAKWQEGRRGTRATESGRIDTPPPSFPVPVTRPRHRRPSGRRAAGPKPAAGRGRTRRPGRVPALRHAIGAPSRPSGRESPVAPASQLKYAVRPTPPHRRAPI